MEQEEKNELAKRLRQSKKWIEEAIGFITVDVPSRRCCENALSGINSSLELLVYPDDEAEIEYQLYLQENEY